MDKAIDGAYIISLYEKLSVPPAWMNSANCSDIENVNVLFSLKEMKPFCESCPVSSICYRWAVDNELQSGVFGGIDFSSKSEDNNPNFK